MYAPSNAKVTNALMTTAKMERMIDSEVSKQISVAISKIGKEISQQLKGNKNEDSNNHIEYKPTFNMEINNDFDEKLLNRNLEKTFKQELHKIGKK